MDRFEQVAFQRRFYAETAERYDAMHGDAESEWHERALRSLFANIEMLGATTLLDIGAGTGRAQRLAEALGVSCQITGIEPVAALRAQGHGLGVPEGRLIDGDATALAFDDDSFDIVCETAVLHHVRDDLRAVREMCRVARLGVFLADSNNYGQGSPTARLVKNALWRAGLWPLVDWIKTGGRRYSILEGDGLLYSFSIFDTLPTIQAKFPQVYFFSTAPVTSGNLPLGAPHLAVLATK